MVCISLGALVVNKTVVIASQGFDKYCDRWYKADIDIQEVDRVDEMLEWIECNIQGWKKHTTWRYVENKKFEVRFRHERDCEWFILRWS
jgi:hypothetical protein